MLRLPLVLSCLLVAFVVAASPSAAAEASLTRPVATKIEGAGAEPRVSLGPSRFDAYDAKPGDTLEYELVVRNTTPATIRIRPKVLPIEGSPDPDEYARVGGRSSRGKELLDWVTYPGFGSSRDLAAGTELRVPVRIQVPTDPPPGTYSLGLSITWTVSAIGVDTTDAPASRVTLTPTLSSVAVIRLPGDVVPEARLRDVQAPRIVWGGQSPQFSARVENVGDTDLVIDAKVDLNAFIGTASRTLDAAGPAQGQPALPGGTRLVKMRWSDPPLVGWFEPELVVVGGKGSGVRISKDLDTVYVLPPWWLILLVVIAIALPLRARRRRRRDPQAQDARRARARHRVEERMRKAEARRRAEAARRRR